MTNAAIYARISADRDGDGLGVGRQQKDCRRLCIDRDWTVAREYVDNNISATAKRAVRPEYRRLLRDIAEGQIDVVVVYDLDRLTRRPIELEEFVNTCAAAGVTQLVFVGGGVDMGTGDGLLVARIKGAFAAEEARKASQRGKRKKLELAERGLPSGGGFRPFGFENDRVTHKPDEADLVREAARRVLGGESMTGIVGDWRQRGHLTSTGGVWTITTLKKMLCNVRTAGLREYRGRVVGNAVWDALLDLQTWDQVVTVLNDPSQRLTKARLGYPLRSILCCGECGTLMDSRLKQGPSERMRGYRCRVSSGGCGRVHVSGPPLEEYVFDLVLALTRSQRLRTAFADEGAKDSTLVRNLVVQNAEDEQTLRHLDDGFGDHRIVRAAWLHQRQRVEARIVERTSRLAEHQGWSELDKLGKNPRSAWETVSADEKRTITKCFIASIRVFRRTGPATNQFNPDRITIIWRNDDIRAELAR